MPEEPTPLQEAREELSKFNGLMKNPGWVWLFDQAQEDVQRILNTIATFPRQEITQDTIASWTFQLGEIAGILKHFEKPKFAAAAAQEHYDQLMEQIKDEEDDRGSEASP